MDLKVLAKYQKFLNFLQEDPHSNTKITTVFFKVKYVSRQYEKLNSLYWGEDFDPQVPKSYLLFELSHLSVKM